MRFTAFTTFAILSLASAVRGQADNKLKPTPVITLKPLPSARCPPLHCGPIRRSCVQGRCIEERIACFEEAIICPDTQN
ncbi:hypothetical protein C8R45DRAFT_1098388 [Mycena sanguinolenta]|nr:hypothetical protein C8R45DRAFT_1098388 [Mycena sanguinolenta]